MISVSIIIPAYNEEKGIISCLNQIREVIGLFKLSYELIVINDGSTDNTKQLAENYCNNIENCKLINKKNGGFGSAIKEGIKTAEYENIIYVPVDSPVTHEVFQSFYNNFGKADLLISYRAKRLGYTKRMLFNAKLYHKLISKLFNLNFRDYNWIHAYKKSKIENLHIKNNNFFFLAETIIEAKKNGLIIKEFPVKMVKRTSGFASASSWKTGFKMLFDLFYYRIKY